ncbi:MAG: DUF1643 domain-containing protein [Gammaproteobacteria bacterium]
MNEVLKNTAKISKCKTYRYALWRTWDNSKPYVMFICLNPSTADEKADDPTLRRCINFAKAWGYGGVCTANLFAFRATEPLDMKAAKDPVGPENNKWLKKLAKDADLIVAAWGNDGLYLERSIEVKKLISNLYCLKLNKSGEPAHPLYQGAKIRPMLMDE